MGGESEDIPRVLVNGMPRGNEFRVRNATLRVARLGHAIRDYLLHMLFRFHFPFLPTLCARDGFLDTPPASRENAKMRRKASGDSFGLYRPPGKTLVQRKGIDLKLLFKFFIFSNFRSSRTAFDLGKKRKDFIEIG